MRNIILADDPSIHTRLLPLTFTRPISELICGALTIRSKWQNAIPGEYSYLTVPYLNSLYPAAGIDTDTLVIASHILPSTQLVDAILSLRTGEALVSHGNDGPAIATCGPKPENGYRTVPFNGPEPVAITRPYHLFLFNGQQIISDLTHLAPRCSHTVSPSCTVIGDPDMIYIHPTARVQGAFLNTANGPIFIGPEAEVMEGSCLRGPIAILNHATVNMGTRIYGDTTIGPHCKVGGELNNVVMIGYSNKAHDGFLGNAVIGQWCNIGAGAVASNLKNDYTEIKLWDYESRRFLRTGLQFCGLIMGDHSKAGINTMFNTATVLGVGVNIHGSGFPRNFIASFSEGSAAGFTEVPRQKFFAIAARVMARRGVTLSDDEKQLYEQLYDITETYR